MKKISEILSIITKRKFPVLTYREYELLISDIQKIWGYKSKRREDIAEELIEAGLLKVEGTLDETDGFYKFYILNNTDPDIFDIASTRSRGAYFSYYSALYINGLTLQIPKQIYLTLERTFVPADNPSITQQAIDKAFAKKPRITTDKRSYRNYEINFINGQGQNNTGVTSFREIYKVSDTERSLIDASVRPFYCGGVTQVMEAFQNAKDTVDEKKLLDYYSQMHFIYPYSNIIGFYLENAGYRESAFLPFLGIRDSAFKIYLTYNMRDPLFSEKWKIYYPKGLI